MEHANVARSRPLVVPDGEHTVTFFCVLEIAASGANRSPFAAETTSNGTIFYFNNGNNGRLRYRTREGAGQFTTTDGNINDRLVALDATTIRLLVITLDTTDRLYPTNTSKQGRLTPYWSTGDYDSGGVMEILDNHTTDPLETTHTINAKGFDGGQPGWGALIVGASYDNGSLTPRYQWGDYIYETGMFNSVLSAEDISKLHQYMSAKYNLSNDNFN